jgi:cytochrome c553
MVLRWRIFTLAALWAIVGLPASAADPLPVPAWLFPQEGDLPQAPYNRVRPLRLPDSSRSYTQEQLFDQFAVPDWHPDSHPPMPEVVAHGRPPSVYACGYCHLANGQGRPENAALAGLPQNYMLQQLANFQAGTRRVAWTGSNAPSDSMIALAAHLEGEDARAATGYFAQLKLNQRSNAIEGAMLPAFRASGWTYVPLGHGRSVKLGERLIEMAPEALRDARRDDELRYNAYVPEGSIARGRVIAVGQVPGDTSCVSCHGQDLRGVSIFPPIAGRSASYLLRQLYAFRNGTRRSDEAEVMARVVAPLSAQDFIAVAAYAASLPP